MNNWLQQLNEAYKRILKESEEETEERYDGPPHRYWSSIHKWNEINQPEQWEYGSDRFYGDGKQMAQNSGAPTGYLVHAHSGQIVPKETVHYLAKREAEAFHKAGHDFEKADHGAIEEQGILYMHGLEHIDTDETPEGVFDGHEQRLEVRKEEERGRKATPYPPHMDRHLKHYLSLKQSK